MEEGRGAGCTQGADPLVEVADHALGGEADRPGIGALVGADFQLGADRLFAADGRTDGAGWDVHPLSGVQLVGVAPEVLVPGAPPLAARLAVYLQAGNTRNDFQAGGSAS